MSGRRQSSRLKALPQKAFKDDSDDEQAKETANPKRTVKKLKDEESFRVGNDSKQQPKKKRARTSITTSSGSGGGGKLSLLPTMPLDILYTIFSYLPPKSLLALTKVNSVFRKALLSPDNTFIWTRVRKSCKAPDPFLGTVSEVEWVRILFGSTRCQDCGHRGVQNVNFVLHKRICYSCVRKTGINQRAFKDRFPGVDKGVLDLVVPTSGGHKTGHANYYNISEIEHVLERLGSCQDPEEAEKFKKERKEYTERLTAHNQACCKWVSEEHERHVRDVDDVRLERFEAIKSRLMDMGHVDMDIEGVKDLACVAQSKPLTERAWATIKNEVSDAVADYRVLRFLTEQTDVATSRRRLIARCYTDYKKSLTPEERLLLPSIEAIWLLPSMTAVLVLPDNVQVTEVDLAVALASLPEDSKTVMETVKDITSERAFGIGWAFNPYCPPDGTNEKWLKNFAGENLWNMCPAAIQARCLVCKCLCTSLYTLSRHLTGPCRIRMVRDKGFDCWYGAFSHTFCSRTAACLVWITGLDLATATADEMDDKGAVYECLKCPSDAEAFVGTWRECILHAHERLPGQFESHENDHHQGARLPTFKILESSESERSDSKKYWACNRCSEHVDEPATREAVVAHLRDQHDISEPHVPKDFLYVAITEEV